MKIQNLKKKKKKNNSSDRRKTRLPKVSAIAKTLSDKHVGKQVVEEEVKTLKQQMEFILGVTKTGLDIIDSEFNIRYVDPEWAKTYGDQTGRKCYEYFMGGSAPCPGCGIPKALKTKKPTVSEEILVKENCRPIQVTTIPFQSSNGEWLVAEVNVDISERKRIEEALLKAHEELETRVQDRTAQLALANEAMQLEITERKQAEDTLRSERDKFRGVLLAIGEGVDIVTKDYIIEFQNELLRERFGDKVGEQCYAAYMGLGEPCHFCCVQEAIRTGSATRLELVGKDGRNYELNSSPFRDVDGEVKVIESVRDITERKEAEEALRQSEERYRNILENIEDGYYEVDLPGNFTFFNDSLCRMLGYSREEMVGMGNQQYTDQENRKKLFQAFNEVYKKGEPAKGFDWEVVRKDGAKVFGEVSVSLIRDSKGQPTGFRGIARDITDRKRAEEALRESEERYRNILDSIEDGYYEVDIAGNFTFFNNSLCKILGYSKEEMMGMNNRHYMDKETAQRVYQAYNQVYTTGEPLKAFGYTIVRKDGIERFLESHVSLLKNAKGERTGFRGIARDMTERKQIEEALWNEKQRFQTLTENAPFGMVMIDQDSVFKYMNPKFRELFGYDLTEIPDGKTWFRKAYPNPTYRHDVIETWINDLISSKSGEKRSRIFAVTCKDGAEKTINFIPVQLETGENLMACEDITERKRAEKKMAELQEQLRQSQKMEAVGRLAGGIAHDFNNLLTVIKGYSQLSLLDLKEGDPLRGTIQEIQKGTQRATDLTRQLLAFSRRQILDPKVLDLNALLQELDKMLRRIIGEDIELVTLLEEDLGRVKIDPGQFEQMILNLAVNAKDAMPSGGKLSIETSNVELDGEYAFSHVGVTPGHYVRLLVSDTGVGMPRDVMEKIFEPFFTTKEKGKGTGLGLSTVYGIVKQSGGNIWVYSEPGHGTTFKIYLPRVEEELDTLNGRDETDSLPGGSETVLLAEDEQEVRSLAHRLLSQQGYKVLEAANGVEALHIAQAYAGEKIHLLLTDVVMPQMGGIELADQLKTCRPNVKILYTSGYTDDAIVHHGVLVPGTHFLQKPFSHKDLAQKVREVLDG